MDWETGIFIGTVLGSGALGGGLVAAAVGRAARRLGEADHRMRRLEASILAERDSRRGLTRAISGLGRNMIGLENELRAALDPAVARGGAGSASTGVFPHPDDEEDGLDAVERQDARVDRGRV